MRKLYEAADAFEARWLADWLCGQGVPAVVLGEALAGAAGQLPANVFPAVWLVDEADLYRAGRLLDDFLRTGERAAGPWYCPACGERVEAGFDLCWNCGAARPEG